MKTWTLSQKSGTFCGFVLFLVHNSFTCNSFYFNYTIHNLVSLQGPNQQINWKDTYTNPVDEQHWSCNPNKLTQG